MRQKILLSYNIQGPKRDIKEPLFGTFIRRSLQSSKKETEPIKPATQFMLSRNTQRMIQKKYNSTTALQSPPPNKPKKMTYTLGIRPTTSAYIKPLTRKSRPPTTTSTNLFSSVGSIDHADLASRFTKESGNKYLKQANYRSRSKQSYLSAIYATH